MAEPTLRAKLSATRELAPEVREIVLRPLAGRIHFAPGQWISVHLPIGKRPPLVRAYSLAEPESATGELVLTLDRVSGGRGSSFMSGLKPGDELTIAGPYGHFTAPDPLPARLVLVARFTGVVPIRCILRSILGDPRSGGPRPSIPEITLVYGAARSASLIFHEEFSDWDRRLPGFRYLPTVFDGSGGPESRPEVEILAEALGSGQRDFVPMVAGVKAMVRPVREFLTEHLGFERRAVRCETYD